MATTQPHHLPPPPPPPPTDIAGDGEGGGDSESIAESSPPSAVVLDIDDDDDDDCSSCVEADAYSGGDREEWSVVWAWQQDGRSGDKEELAKRQEEDRAFWEACLASGYP